MPKPFRDPEFNETTGMITYVNEVTEGWMTILVLIAAWLIMLIIIMRQGYKTSQAIMATSFMTFVLSTLFWAAGLVMGKIVTIFLLLTVLGTIYTIFDT